MRTYFIRHTSQLDINQTTIRGLYDGGLIAIHYPWAADNPSKEFDTRSLDPKGYDRAGKSALKVLLELSKEGGFVCAEYRNIKAPLLGYVEPNTPIMLYEGVWGNRNKREGRPAILKALNVSKVVRLDPVDYVALSVARPRQGTLVRWRGIKKRVENIVLGNTTLRTLDDLTPDQQEIMCAEYLRCNEEMTSLPYKVESLLVPIGRTMKDIDIVGISDTGHKILAQVTYGKLESHAYKLQRLKSFKTERATAILFCRCSTTTVEDGVIIYPMQRVFDSFCVTDNGQRWLQAIT